MVNNNITFKGYKNILCAYNVPISKTQYATYMSMQLNDDDEYKDLSEYLKVKKLQGFLSNQKNDDVLTLTYVMDFKNPSEHLFLDQKELYLGHELRTIEDKYIPKLMTKEKYEHEKKIHMKVYTLLASLTNRMQYEKFDNEDINRVDVIKRMFNTMYAILKNEKDAFRLTEIACLKKVRFQDLALAFNKGIAETMAKFFR